MSSKVDVRRVAAVVGALVADAAGQPIHWNYNLDRLDAILAETPEVAFIEPSINPFYTLPCGSQSGYGDQSFTILKSLVDNNGLNTDALNKAMYDCFGPDSAYENDTNAIYKDKSDITTKATKYPIHGPWRHFGIKEFLRNFQERKESTGSPTDEQIDCAVRIVPVVALYAGRPEMLSRAEVVVRQTQDNDMCVAVGLAAARILEYCILNGRTDGAVEATIEQLSDQDRECPQELDKAVAGFLREVVRRKSEPHIPVARSIKIS
ncbi:crystallin J1A-like [Mya arenaria]|uniref:crystallin J1A-like n=1 Tax=Mya arenaria TaxID=6604 RepID=UPI0022E7E406|nr:crystallin J1A-like [Mya arenaria]